MSRRTPPGPPRGTGATGIWGGEGNRQDPRTPVTPSPLSPLLQATPSLGHDTEDTVMGAGQEPPHKGPLEGDSCNPGKDGWGGQRSPPTWGLPPPHPLGEACDLGRVTVRKGVRVP